MIGKLNYNGFLYIQRKQEFKEMEYPYSNGVEQGSTVYNPCGDWCPLFGEPENKDDVAGEMSANGQENWYRDENWIELQICQNRILRFDKLTDKRSK